MKNQMIKNLSQYLKIASNITNAVSPTMVCGVSHIHKANIISAIDEQFARPILVVCANDGIARRMAEDIAAFTDKNIYTLTNRDFIFHNISSSSKEMQHKRIETLYKILDKPCVLVATIDSLLSACIPKEILKNACFDIEFDKSYDIKELSEKLIKAGYTRCMQVEGAGQYSIRGGILDIFPVSYTSPVRIEFFGDEIDTISTFDAITQRRNDSIKTVKILPFLEVLPSYYDGGSEALVQRLKDFLNTPQKKLKELETNIKKDIERLENDGIFPAIDRYLNIIYPDIETPIDYLSSKTLVFIDDLPRVTEQANAYFKRHSEDIISLIERGVIIGDKCDYILDFNSFLLKIRSKTTVLLDTFMQKSDYIKPVDIVNIVAKQLPAYAGKTELAYDDIKYYYDNGYKVIILCSGDLRRKNMAEILKGLPVKITETPKGPISILDGSISSGFEYPEIKLAVLTEGQIIAKNKNRKIKKSNRQYVKSYSDLTVGDIVVHEHHGIGRFDGIEKMIVDGSERDYVKISFAGTDSLFVPAANLNLISKYIGSGGEDAKVRLNKLGGIDWQKSKTRAKAAAKDLAKYLIDLYAKRSRLQGFSFNKDDVWQDDFENAFVYEETDDQLRSISEIKEDMEKPIPMDRLLCGDVGFGKTEVAFRAIMKCILSGKQAAILVPTTVLARQHYLTAIERFNGYPIKIEFISRFKTAKEQKLILERLKEGNIDLIIGTHKLFMKEIKFKDLGLLVIDEEQRFGVAHKEKLKELGTQIDVLTLSATPIPRTLNMALSGIRDMSILEEAPHNRQPVETYVLEYDFFVIMEALRREISRNGQCFYLHNRVDTIDSVAYKIQMEIPEAVVEVAHGKMSQAQLSKIMTRMNDGEIDVLVATTIIETGIDISNANTLIIENADHMGLSQLHQIRGRVGRSNKVAYAYLTYKTGKVLSEVSAKRLSAIREFAEFGSGFKIAMRDLEIRGAGDVLGSQQSGHLASVGYELYLKLLEDAVLEEKGEVKTKEIECLIDIKVSANIPESYVSDIGQRIDLYRRIAMIKNDEEYHDMLDEIIDRFSEPPKNVVNLFKIAIIRNIAEKNGVTNIIQKEDRLQIEFFEPDIEKITKLCALEAYKGRMMLSVYKTPYIVIKLHKNENTLKLCEDIIKNIEIIN